ncbi:MAG: hypothetical protein AABZ74_00990 [Cyanobacteriota bacterium]
MENNPKNNHFTLSSILKPIETGNENNLSRSSEIRLDQCISFFMKGKRALDNNEIDNAIKLFEKAIKALKKDDLKIKDNSIYFSYSGLAMQKKGWNSFAQARFKEALSIDPKDSIASNELRKIYKTKQNIKKQEVAKQEVVKQDYPTIKINKINDSFSLSSLLKPVETYNDKNLSRSAEIRLDQCISFFIKGKRALDNNEIDNAIKILENAIKALKPEDLKIKDNSIYFSYLGVAMQKKGWNSFAQARYKEAIAIDPKDNVALKGLKSILIVEKETVKSSEIKQAEKSGNVVSKLKGFFSGFDKK